MRVIFNIATNNDISCDEGLNLGCSEGLKDSNWVDSGPLDTVVEVVVARIVPRKELYAHAFRVSLGG